MSFFQRAVAPLFVILSLTPLIRLQAHGDLSERVAAMREEVVRHPEDGMLQLALAGLLFEDGRFEETTACLDKLDQASPGKFPVDKLRGSALLELHRPAEARQAFDRFLVKFPGDPRALLLRARALSARGVTAAALTDYRESLRRTVAPEPDLYQEVAAALSAGGCQDEALSVLDQGLKRLGQIPSLGQRALDLELCLKRFDAALIRVQSMRLASPRPEQWMAKRASILTFAGRIAESRQAWQELINHLAALPPAERDSNAMCRLAEEGHEGLKQLRGIVVPVPLPASPASIPPPLVISLTK